jgi:NADH-quinone oxidoreductase subunit G
MLEDPRKVFLLWDFEPGHDTHNPALTLRALSGAQAVVAVAAFADESLLEVADVLLPLAPWPENEGSVLALDGRKLDLRPAGKVSGQARSGWKILRRIGQELGLDGFTQVSLADVQADLAAAASTAQPGLEEPPAMTAPTASDGLYRIGAVPMYAVDPLCRRSAPLQSTAHATGGFVGLNPADAGRLGLADGQTVRVAQGEDQATLALRVLDTVSEGAAWIPSGTCATRKLGDAMGPVSVSGEGG